MSTKNITFCRTNRGGEKKMKRAKKFFTVTMTVLILLLMSLFPTYAAESVQDGLKVDLVLDKSDYSSSDTVKAVLEVQNTNDYEIKAVKLSNSIPDGFTQKGKESLSLTKDVLKPNEKISVSSEFTKEGISVPTPDNTSTQDQIVQTGTNSNFNSGGTVATGQQIAIFAVLFCLLAAGILTVYFIRNRKGKHLLSVVLCFLVTLSAIPLGAINTKAAELDTDKQSIKTIDITESFTYATAKVLMKSQVQYDNSNNNVDNLSIDSSQMLFDSEANYFVQANEMSQLKGKLLNFDNVSCAVCTVTDANGKELLKKEFTPIENWSVNDFGLIVGVNYVKIAIVYSDGKTDEENITINNLNKENMKMLSVDMGDDDGDGVLNFTEELYHTNSIATDTDGDGLSDYYEMAVLGTDSNKIDTDNNGVADADEDADADKLTNKQEIDLYKTNPISTDSDGDGLDDYREINELKTNPLKADTDGDGKSDYWELSNRYNPLVANESFDENEVETPKDVTVDSNSPVKVMEAEELKLLIGNIPGYIGTEPIYVDLESGTATIRIKYDTSQLSDGDTPVLYQYNEETQQLEEIPTEVLSNGEVQSTVNGSGYYLLLNQRLVNEVWDNDIYKPVENVDDGSMDVVFVIDRSKSMDENDPEGKRKDVVKQFYNKLRMNVDGAAVVQFSAIAETIYPLTIKSSDSNFDAVVDGIENSDGGGCNGSDQNAGTNGSAALRNALTELNKSNAKHKYIIFLTDGKDTTVSEEYGDRNSGLIGEAKSSDVIIHTVGLVGNGEVDVDLLKKIAEETGGNYYLATVGTPENPNNENDLEKIYEQIESITIDRLTDSNQDGISDFYTKLIVDGTLTSALGTKYFFGTATYEEVQKNADYDGDGLLNGEELQIIEKDDGVYVKQISNVINYDSDFDGLSDCDEIKQYSTNPMKYNEILNESDVSWAIEDDNFVSEKYRKFYDSKFLIWQPEKDATTIGNAFFGTTYDQSLLSEQMLIDYFKSIDDELQQNKMNQYARDNSLSMVNQIFTKIRDFLDTQSEVEDDSVGDKLDSVYDFLQNVADIAGTSIEQINDVNKENLSKITLEVEQTWNKLMSVDSRAFSNTDEYWNYCNKLFEEYNTLSQTNASISKAFNFTSKIQSISKGVNVVFYVTDVIKTGYTTYDEFFKLCSSIDVMKENIYILDCIISQSEDADLVAAAQRLKYRINTMCENDINKFTEFLGTYEFNMPLFSTALGNLVHEMISDCGHVGMIVELVRLFGNVAFNMSDVAQECTKLYAIARTANAMAYTFGNKLNAGEAVNAGDKWVFYSSNQKRLKTDFLQLLLARKCAENQMAEADKANSFLIEWLFANIMYKLSDCNTNVSICAAMISNYK